ncbi:MAG: ATP-binding protein [Pseudanabaena sp.]
MKSKVKSILVVDDEIEIQRLFKQRFRKRIQANELDFIFASNGIEAIEILKNSNCISMVLTDIRMPEMDGLSLISKLAELDQNLKAVVVSAYGDMQNIRMAMNCGAFDFVTKPIDFEDLEITINKTLAFVDSLHEQQQKLEEAIKQVRSLELKEIALAHAKEIAEASNAAKSAFLANMSHELRTPLNSILGLNEALQDEIFGKLNDKQLGALKTIESSSEHLLELINDILDLAKIEADQIQLNCELTSVQYLCQSSLTFVKQQAIQKQIHLSSHVAEDIPDLLIDERRMLQVLINLLNNAVKFTPVGGKVILDTHYNNDDKYVLFSITDTGIGISPENIKKLFQPFIQIDSDLNRQYEGTGLGLALAKRIVELHNGKMGLTSTVGVGSCFTVEIPYASKN